MSAKNIVNNADNPATYMKGSARHILQLCVQDAGPTKIMSVSSIVCSDVKQEKRCSNVPSADQADPNLSFMHDNIYTSNLTHVKQVYLHR